MFDATRIKNATALNQVDVHAELGSTNDQALALVRQNKIAVPALIVAEHQTAGRGQRQRKWWAGEGSLTFSWIVADDDPDSLTNERRPKTGADHQRAVSMLPLAAALAVADAVESLTPLSEIQIKWPNDLLVSGRKLSGILIESIATQSGRFFVVGIGINVNNESISREDLDSPDNGFSAGCAPTSILIESGKRTSPESLLIALINRLTAEFDSVGPQLSSIVKRCNSRLAFADQRVSIQQSSGQTVSGICLGVNSAGALKIQTESGLSIVHSGTVVSPA